MNSASIAYHRGVGRPPLSPPQPKSSGLVAPPPSPSTSSFPSASSSSCRWLPASSSSPPLSIAAAAIAPQTVPKPAIAHAKRSGFHNHRRRLRWLSPLRSPHPLPPTPHMCIPPRPSSSSSLPPARCCSPFRSERRRNSVSDPLWVIESASASRYRLSGRSPLARPSGAWTRTPA